MAGLFENPTADIARQLIEEGGGSFLVNREGNATAYTFIPKEDVAAQIKAAAPREDKTYRYGRLKVTRYEDGSIFLAIGNEFGSVSGDEVDKLLAVLA
jgi:hypothetical protein